MNPIRGFHLINMELIFLENEIIKVMDIPFTELLIDGYYTWLHNETSYSERTLEEYYYAVRKVFQDTLNCTILDTL